MVSRDNGLVAPDVPVSMRPAPSHGIAQPNPVARCGLRLTCDDLSDGAAKRLHVLGGRCEKDCAVRVWADMWPEHVTPRLNLGDAGFLW